MSPTGPTVPAECEARFKGQCWPAAKCLRERAVAAADVGACWSACDAQSGTTAKQSHMCQVRVVVLGCVSAMRRVATFWPSSGRLRHMRRVVCSGVLLRRERLCVPVCV